MLMKERLTYMVIFHDKSFLKADGSVFVKIHMHYTNHPPIPDIPPSYTSHSPSLLLLPPLIPLPVVFIFSVLSSTVPPCS
jgi:hypothetical protein